MNKINDILRKLNFDDHRISEIDSRLEQYMGGVLEWNEKVNLTSITDRDEFIDKHFADSIMPALSPEFLKAQSVADLGTGGGFPGIPLAVLFPEKEFVLIDSLNKRLNIINTLCKEIKIENVTTVHGRAEDIAKPGSALREYFDICVSRAVADLPVLCEYCLPLVKKGGFFIAYKTSDDEEFKRAENAIKILGGKTDRTEKTDNGHSLLYIRKIDSTPDKYPRLPGKPTKKPL